MRFIGKRLRLATVPLWLAVVASFFARWWWPFDLACHFRVQYVWLLSISALLLLLCRNWRWASVSGFLALVNLGLVLPLYFGPSVEPSESPKFRIVSLNVLTQNRQYDRAIKMLRETKADILVIQEVDTLWSDALSELKTEYPFQHVVPRPGNFGLAIYSRYPIDATVERLGDRGVPAIVAHCEANDRQLTIIVGHVLPPVGSEGSRLRNQGLGDLAQLAAAQQGPVLLLGDLNITSWSPYFHDLLRISHLRDSRPGFGVQPTWHTQLPLLRIPIDHCLVSAHVTVHNLQVSHAVGSDHFGIIVDFSVEP